jgi:hypothetical protein
MLYLHAPEFFFFFDGSRVWRQGFILAKQVRYHLSTPPVHFALVILEMGSLELFVWAGLEPWSFWISVSQVARITGANHQHLAHVPKLGWLCLLPVKIPEWLWLLLLLIIVFIDPVFCTCWACGLSLTAPGWVFWTPFPEFKKKKTGSERLSDS